MDGLSHPFRPKSKGPSQMRWKVWSMVARTCERTTLTLTCVGSRSSMTCCHFHSRATFLINHGATQWRPTAWVEIRKRCEEPPRHHSSRPAKVSQSGMKSCSPPIYSKRAATRSPAWSGLSQDFLEKWPIDHLEGLSHPFRPKSKDPSQMWWMVWSMVARACQRTTLTLTCPRVDKCHYVLWFPQLGHFPNQQWSGVITPHHCLVVAQYRCEEPRGTALQCQPKLANLAWRAAPPL